MRAAQRGLDPQNLQGGFQTEGAEVLNDPVPPGPALLAHLPFI